MVGAVFSLEVDLFDIEATGTGSKFNGIVKISSEYQLGGGKSTLRILKPFTPVGFGRELSPFVALPLRLC